MTVEWDKAKAKLNAAKHDIRLSEVEPVLYQHAKQPTGRNAVMKAEYDLSAGKRGAVLPANGKTRITIWIDDDILDAFRNRAEAEGIGYQTLLNQTLRASLSPAPALDEDKLRQIIREEMQAGKLAQAA